MKKLPMINMLLGIDVTGDLVDGPPFTFPSSWRDTSPVYHVTTSSVPTVLAYGVNDELVSYTNAAWE